MDHERITIAPSDLRTLFYLVKSECEDLYGPSLKDGAITLSRLAEYDQLPVGLRDSQTPGHYIVRQTEERSHFNYAVGPHSIKKVLHPSNRQLWSSSKSSSGEIFFSEPARNSGLIGFWGLRSCDVEAIKILDGVFLESGVKEPHYQSLRENLFILTATCSEPSKACFCTSMGHGPRAAMYDINLTEVHNADEHFFVANAGTSLGAKVLGLLNAKRCEENELIKSEAVYQAACKKITKTMDTDNLPKLLAQNMDHPQWEVVADQCLSCGNCTMVCPTCFCTTTYDVNDLEGEHSERWLRWDSCFTADFSYIHGGNIRSSTKSRYRQWLTHKLSTWYEQFGSSGCVGCGRCVAWCPVAIDLTQEVEALRSKS